VSCGVVLLGGDTSSPRLEIQPFCAIWSDSLALRVNAIILGVAAELLRIPAHRLEFARICAR